MSTLAPALRDVRAAARQRAFDTSGRRWRGNAGTPTVRAGRDHRS
ncbi:hypothetical protein QF026_008398 [Streptomyces aurantiacus]|nr:hypothetical protein [Streptomyces aurantiacus]MDQ0779932.1 hypothetical protein [Streptomyces aurantiacus]